MKDFVIGRIHDIKQDAMGLFKQATVIPAVDFEKLEEVFVILEQRSEPSL